ncbi:MAG: septal ring lytic transglycosylase RlpA family protein [Cytophagales bacterium]|nr:septal ring lytic transglycosylase RlpA family protein [Cytophagales bacterium]
MIVIFIFFVFIFSQEAFPQIGFQQVGKASYYDTKFHGRRTSSGERYNQNKLTAAHRKLKFHTMVRVTNLANDRSIIVRINDRGPYKYKGRIIDLSRAAAKELGIIDKGITKVKITVIGKNGAIPYIHKAIPLKGSFDFGKYYSFRGEQIFPKGYGIQVATFYELSDTRYFAGVLFSEGFRQIHIKPDTFQAKPYYNVILGEYPTRNMAVRFVPVLQHKDLKCMIVGYQ